MRSWSGLRSLFPPRFGMVVLCASFACADLKHRLRWSEEDAVRRRGCCQRVSRLQVCMSHATARGVTSPYAQLLNRASSGLVARGSMVCLPTWSTTTTNCSTTTTMRTPLHSPEFKPDQMVLSLLCVLRDATLTPQPLSSSTRQNRQTPAQS